MKKKHKNQEINLSNAFSIAMLNEGLFDKLMDFLEFLTRSYYSGAETYDKSGMVKTNASKANFDPKASIGDQIHAAACAAQLVSYAIEEWVTRQPEFEAGLQAASSVAGSDKLFTEKSQQVLQDIGMTMGRSMAALTDSELEKCSKRIYTITKTMKPVEETSETLKNFHRVLNEIFKLDLIASIKKITSEEAAQKYLSDSKDIARSLQKHTAQIESNFAKAITNVLEISFQVADLEDLIKEKGNSPDVAASASAVKGTTFESSQENLIRQIIREELTKKPS